MMNGLAPGSAIKQPREVRFGFVYVDRQHVYHFHEPRHKLCRFPWRPGMTIEVRLHHLNVSEH